MGDNYEDHIKEIQKIKHNFKSADGSRDYKKIFINTAKSMSIVGAINLLIYVIFTFLVQLYMTQNTNIFENFRWYHHLLWIAIIFVQVAYILYLILYPSAVNSLMDGALYDIFTIDVIKNRKFEFNTLLILVKNLLRAILLEPLMEYILLIVLVIIPWPFLKNVSYSKRLQMIILKAGIFSVIISLSCLDYDRKSDTFLELQTELEVP
jgi:hypothetical protein